MTGNSSGQAEDRKPTINLKVKINKDESEVFFRIKRSTKLQKVVDALCAKRSLDPKALIFMFYGDHINKDKTAEEHKMEDGDEIDVFLLSDGGSMIVES